MSVCDPSAQDGRVKGRGEKTKQVNGKSTRKQPGTIVIAYDKPIQSNRYCYNDGYHTSHHLNPLRHWREHPVHFLQNKGLYSREDALVFYDIDYLMITVRLLMRDYEHLAHRLVPIGKQQIDMTMRERVNMLRARTRRFTEEDIRTKFCLGESR
jgi:hypothetical protein